MAAAVTVGAALIGFPIAYYMARYATGRAKALLYLAVMLPLWSSYLVRVYAWKLILAKEGVISWAFAEARLCLAARRGPGAAGDRRPLALGILYRHVPGVHLHLAAVHDPADPGGARAGAEALLEASADLGAGRARPSAP